MSTINSKNVQVGTSGVANQNFTLYQPNTPDGTVRLGVGNSGATTSDVVTVTNAGNMTVSGVVTATTLSGAGSFTTVSASGNMSFNSGYGSAAVAYGCRAWVNFNGTSTVAIRASGNVSSITDNGTGDYTVNLTTAMPDANFASQLTQGNTDGTNPPGNLSFGLRSVSTTACRVNLRDSAGNQTDMPSVNVIIFR